MAKIADIAAEDREGLIIIKHPSSGAEKAFLRTACAVRWGNPEEIDRSLSQTAIVLAGEGEDHRITVMRSYQGEGSVIRKRAIELKDMFLVKRIFAPPEPPGQFEALQREDGLQKYYPAPPFKDLMGHPVYRVNTIEECQRVWPSFRNRRLRASVIAHDPRFLGDIPAAALMVEDLIAARKVNIDLLLAPGLEAARKKQMQERLKDILYLAMIGLVWEMFQSIRPPRRDREDQSPVWNPYYNRRR